VSQSNGSTLFKRPLTRRQYIYVAHWSERTVSITTEKSFNQTYYKGILLTLESKAKKANEKNAHRKERKKRKNKKKDFCGR
jgi:hypothetical protein